MANPLKLLAMDAEDLDVISAHIQNAKLKIRDMRYLPSDKRFACVMDRYTWERQSEVEGEACRCLTGLHFNTVSKVRHMGLDRSSPETELTILAVQAMPEEQGSPTQIMLVFEGDGAICLSVECIEASLSDFQTPSQKNSPSPSKDTSHATS
jgi:Protein of unknown function (DUF2948)